MSRTAEFEADERSTVTITISRESAEALHRYYPAEDRPHELELDAALGTALGAQHEYDNSPELQALLRRAALEGEQ